MVSEKELIKKAVLLHGHYGPSLMLGLKSCLYAKSALGEVSKCTIRTIGRKPYLCVLDGIRASSQAKIEVEEEDGLTFIFFNGPQKLKMTLKETQFRRYFDRPWDELEQLADEVIVKDVTELFDIVIPPHILVG